MFSVVSLTEVDPAPNRKQLCGGSAAAMKKMLQFGRELRAMSEQLKQEYGTNEANKKAMLDAFSLLAYSNPWSSPVGYQLDPVQREPVCAALNSAILGRNTDMLSIPAGLSFRASCMGEIWGLKIQ